MNLNEACPKDSYLLPRIDQLVETTAGHKLLSFIDTYSSSNQIRVHPPDENKIALTTGREIYYYKVMPFGLKNAGATFQQIVNKVFNDLIGDTIKVYMDDMLVKSVQRMEHLQHLDKAFNLLKQYKVKLNPENCTFGVASGKFLGYLITQRGIKVDLDQISAIMNMKSPTCIKEVQMLNGHLAALNRFISRSTNECKSFFQTLKKKAADFRCNEECEMAFQELKRYLVSPSCYRNPPRERRISTSLSRSQQ